MTRTSSEIEETLTLRLAGDSRAPSRARHALDSLDGAIEIEEVRSDVGLLVSELVTNSIRHGGAGPGSTIEIAARAAPEMVRVEVFDEGPGFDAAEAKRDRDVGGYGLQLVEMLANRWGIEGKPQPRVWFEINYKRAEPTGTAEKRFVRRAHG